MVVAVGIFTLLVTGCMLIVATIRFIVFSALGLMDQVFSRRTFINALLGTVSVSVVPAGGAEVDQLQGNGGFLHTKIYRAPEVLDRVADRIHIEIEKDSVPITS